jgi:hypothetical protein
VLNERPTASLLVGGALRVETGVMAIDEMEVFRGVSFN